MPITAEAISYATFSSSKQLLNDLFDLFTMKTSSHNNQLYSSVATKKKDSRAKRYLRTSMTFSHSLMVPANVSKFDYVGLILLDLGVKVNEICYCSLRPPQ